jgi:DNA-3-methyladenine glycosylase II
VTDKPTLSTELFYTPPYDWGSVLYFFQAHQVPYLESVDARSYERVVPTSRGLGWFRVFENERRTGLHLNVWNASEQDLVSISDQVRRMFDLNANPGMIRQAMNADEYLAGVWSRHPGLRVSRAWSSFETLLNTVLGQVVSVSFGRTLVGELMRAAGAEESHPKTGQPIHLFPTPERILEADLSSVRTSDARRASLRSLAALVANGTLNWKESISAKELRATLRSVPGIGVWTSEYVAMRGFGDNDAFPATDYGLKQELKRHPEMDVERVRPWRAYAAAALWKNYAESKSRLAE